MQPLSRLSRWFCQCLLVGLFLSASACSVIEADAPPVPDSTMVEAMVDLHLLNARSETLYDVTPAQRQEVLAVHGLDTTQFAQALTFYADDPELLLDLYARVLDQLNEERFAE